MVETKMGERGPKLAVGSDGAIHIVWQDEWAPGVRTYVRYSRSLDGGKIFAPLTRVSLMSGVDGVTMAADGAGNVVAFWHVMNNPPPDVAVIVRLKGDSQLIGIQAPGFDEGAEGRDEIIPPMWRTVCFSR